MEEIEYPNFNKMTYSEIINWIDQEALRRLRLGVVVNDEEIRNLKLKILSEKITNLLEEYNKRIENIEETLVKITDIIKGLSEQLVKKKDTIESVKSLNEVKDTLKDFVDEDNQLS